MRKATTMFAELDVHKDQIAVAYVDVLPKNPTGAVPSRLKTLSSHADDDHGLNSTRLFIAAARDKKP